MYYLYTHASHTQASLAHDVQSHTLHALTAALPNWQLQLLHHESLTYNAIKSTQMVVEEKLKPGLRHGRPAQPATPAAVLGQINLFAAQLVMTLLT